MVCENAGGHNAASTFCSLISSSSSRHYTIEQQNIFCTLVITFGFCSWLTLRRNPAQQQARSVSCNGIMTKRFPKIITISAAVLFVLAFLLDLSYSGQDWKSFWKSVDMTRLVIIIAIITVVGLLLALFLFRKETFRQGLLWTLPIAFILFSVADITKVAIGYY